MDQARRAVVPPERPRPGGIAGERKPVTALFVDIVGSTSLAESMDPEEWAEIVAGALGVLSRPVERYEGTIDKFLGDGMLVYFGAPTTHEDDAERAVRAALEMVDAVRGYSDRLIDSRGPGLQVRVGLHTGLVVVAQLLGDPGGGRTAIGDTVNVAARMQAAADPGTIRITEATARRVSHAFEVRDLGAIAVKGKAEPVHAFEVVGPLAVRLSPRGLRGITSPLVGRAHELEVLRAMLAGVTAESGTAALVLGEPGIGKSRLLREFREEVESSGGARWVEAQTVSYGRTLPFHLLVDLVARVAALPDGDPMARRAGLGSALGDGGPEPHDQPDVGADRSPGSTVDLLAHLLSLPVPDAVRDALERLDPDRLRRRYADAVGTLVGSAARDAPLVVLIEDLHWADESSVATLTWLTAVLASLPTLVVVTSRPDPGSVGEPLLEAMRSTYGPRAHELALSALSETESRDLVAHLLEIESLPDAVRATILSRAEGNPFFVEEIIRMLIEDGVVVRRGERWVARQGIEAVEIPPTVQGLLLARIDALPDHARDALRTASVIGRTFALGMLERVAGPLDGAIDVLEDAGLVAPDPVAGPDRLSFRHALVQETAYDSILKRDRAELHRKVAEQLMRAEPERLDELAAELAMHFDAAGDRAEAAEWAFRAARNAERRSAMPEARELYDRAASWLPDEPATRRRRVEIALGQGRSGLYFRAFDTELARLSEAAAWAEGLGDARLLVEVYTAIAFALQIRGDQYETSPDLRRAVDRAVEIGASLGDDPVRGRPLLARGGAALMAGAYEAAVEDLAAAVPLLESAGDLLWAFEAQNSLAWAYARLGRRADADAAVARAVELAEQSGSASAKVDVKSTIAINYQEREEFDTALRVAREAAAEGEEQRILTCAAFGHLTAGEILLARGETAEAERSLNRATRLARLTQAAFIENLGRAGLNAARWATGRRDDALAGWADALDHARASGDPFGAADVLWRRGTALAGDASTRADGIADLEAAARDFASLGAKPARARVLRDLSAPLAAAGRGEDAERTMMEASELRGELGLEAAPPV